MNSLSKSFRWFFLAVFAFGAVLSGAVAAPTTSLELVNGSWAFDRDLSGPSKDANGNEIKDANGNAITVPEISHTLTTAPGQLNLTVNYPQTYLVQYETSLTPAGMMDLRPYTKLQITYTLSSAFSPIANEGKDVELLLFDYGYYFEILSIHAADTQSSYQHMIADGAPHTITIDLSRMHRSNASLQLVLDEVNFPNTYGYTLTITSFKLVGPKPAMNGEPATPAFDGQAMDTSMSHGNTTASGALATSDGLELLFSSTGGVTNLYKTGHSTLVLGNSAQPGGFLVRDTTSTAAPTQVTGTMTKVSSTKYQQTGSALNLNTTATYQTEGSLVHVTLSATNTSASDRYLTLYFALPLAWKNWIWQADLLHPTAVNPPSSPAVMGPFNEENTVLYPLATLKTSSGAGVALAVPLDEPRNFRIEYNEQYGIFYAAFDVALTNLTGPNGSLNTATCDVYLYQCDPAWGFRSALQSYYTAFSQWFTKHVAGGGWGINTNGSNVNPLGTGFAWGETAWVPQAGTENAQGQPAGWQANNAGGVKNMVYIEPIYSQISMTGLDPSSTDAANRVTGLIGQDSILWGQFQNYNYTVTTGWDRWSTHNPSDGTADEVAFETFWSDMALAIQNSATVDSLGRITYNMGYQDFARDPSNPFGLDMMTPCNLDPTIPGGRGQLALALVQNDDVGNAHYGGTSGDGFALDSFGGDYTYDYNTNNFPYSPFPLSFDRGVPQQKAVPVRLTMGAWIAALHSQQPTKITLANMSGGNNTFCVPYTDVYGAESNFVRDPGYMRSMAYNRAVTYLPYVAQTDDDTYYNLLYDIYPGWGLDQDSSATDQGAPIKGDGHQYEAMVPVLDALDQAGWQPVTYVTPSDAGIRVERYGSGNTYYLVFYNTNIDRRPDPPVAVTTPFSVAIDPSLGAWGQAVGIFGPQQGQLFTPSNGGISLSLDSGKVCVLKVQAGAGGMQWTAQPIGISGDSEILVPNSSQTLIAALAFSKTYDDTTTVNGVDFTAAKNNNDATTPITYNGVAGTVTTRCTPGAYDYISQAIYTNHTTFDPGTNSNYSPDIPVFLNLSGSYQTLLLSGLGGSPSTANANGDCLSGNDTITVNSLTVGKTYIVRFWANYNTGATAAPLTLSSGTGVGQYITAGEGDGANRMNGSTFTAIFKATATSQTFGFASAGYPIVNAIEVIQQN